MCRTWLGVCWCLGVGIARWAPPSLSLLFPPPIHDKWTCCWLGQLSFDWIEISRGPRQWRIEDGGWRVLGSMLHVLSSNFCHTQKDKGHERYWYIKGSFQLPDIAAFVSSLYVHFEKREMRGVFSYVQVTYGFVGRKSLWYKTWNLAKKLLSQVGYFSDFRPVSEIVSRRSSTTKYHFLNEIYYIVFACSWKTFNWNIRLIYLFRSLASLELSINKLLHSNYLVSFLWGIACPGCHENPGSHLWCESTSSEASRRVAKTI